MSETSQPNPDVTQDVAQKYDSELASPPIQREVASVSASELKEGAVERAGFQFTRIYLRSFERLGGLGQFLIVFVGDVLRIGIRGGVVGGMRCLIAHGAGMGRVG